MKHYRIRVTGDNSEKLLKTPTELRKTIRYYRYHEDYIEVIEIEPGDYGVTEEDVRRFYAAEDHEVYMNIKARRPRRSRKEKAEIAAWKDEYIRNFDATHGFMPTQAEVQEATEEMFPTYWTESLDEIIEANNDKSALLPVVTPSFDTEPGFVEKMDEIVAKWPRPRREIYERVLKNGESIVSIARERGVSEGKIRRELEKIRKTLRENSELVKYLRYMG